VTLSPTFEKRKKKKGEYLLDDMKLHLMMSYGFQLCFQPRLIMFLQTFVTTSNKARVATIINIKDTYRHNISIVKE
jgi:hypothetical protein